MGKGDFSSFYLLVQCRSNNQIVLLSKNQPTLSTINCTKQERLFRPLKFGSCQRTDSNHDQLDAEPSNEYRISRHCGYHPSIKNPQFIRIPERDSLQFPTVPLAGSPARQITSMRPAPLSRAEERAWPQRSRKEGPPRAESKAVLSGRRGGFAAWLRWLSNRTHFRNGHHEPHNEYRPNVFPDFRKNRYRQTCLEVIWINPNWFSPLSFVIIRKY